MHIQQKFKKWDQQCQAIFSLQIETESFKSLSKSLRPSFVKSITFKQDDSASWQGITEKAEMRSHCSPFGGVVHRRPFPFLSYLQHPSDCSGLIWGCTSHRQERRKMSSEQLLPPSLRQSKQSVAQADRNMVQNDPSLPALITKLTRLFDLTILIERLITSGFHFTASLLWGRCLIC